MNKPNNVMRRGTILHIGAFSSCRFIWAMMIMSSHLTNVYLTLVMGSVDTYSYIFLLNGHYAATGFFVLSGFLIHMHYGEKIANSEISLKSCLSFTIKHVKKWYLLYLITMLPFLVWFGCNRHYAAKDLLLLIMNLCLAQTWLWGKDYSINGITWYLSCITFIYLLVPLVVKLYKKLINRNQRVIWPRWWLTLIVFFCMIYILQETPFAYKSPIFHFFQFCIGFFLYDAYRHVRPQSFTVSAIVILLQIFAYVAPPTAHIFLLDTVAAAAFVYVFSGKEHVLVLNHPILTRLGGYGVEIMLIHYPLVTILYGDLLPRFFRQNIYTALAEAFAIIIITLLLSIFYRKFCLKKIRQS